jgi:hypothetical protein
MKKDQEKQQAYAEIMHLFRYFYKDAWAPGNMFDNKSRVWIQCFNELVKQGYILKKKVYPGYKYKWAGVWPEGY